MLDHIVKQFFPEAEVETIEPFGKGHINTTYKLDLKGREKSYILQRINTQVFKNPRGIADTHQRLQESIFNGAHPIQIAELIPTAGGDELFVDEQDEVWRMTSFIEGSYTQEVVDEPWQAAEAGNAYGWFARACSNLDPSLFTEAIEDFHRLSFRIRQLDEAIEADKAGRLASVSDIVHFFKQRQDTFSQIEDMVDQGRIPLRIVHNDTKINNLLFKGSKAVAVIDLDTVGPGILYYDYGDALRTCASTAEEDEKDTDKMDFNFEAFTAFTQGYMKQVRDMIAPDEREYFYLAPLLMTYIIGIRFLTDYLNGDVYYKTAYGDHNLVRTRTQQKLIERMEQRKTEMAGVIEEALA